ncbi:MAG: hypothetical protein ABSA48_15160 [Terracidiphilus sp.]|jgi:hypothetical protein
MLLYCGREGPWSVAGNDGEMAEPQQVLKTEGLSGKTNSATNKRKRKRASREKTARKNGAERLRLAVDRRLGLNSETLAVLLTNKALRGDVVTTKALVEIAEGKKPRPEPKKKRRGPSLAEQLAMEPQWQDEQEEGCAETGSGGVEAEG